jgi:hypothetical protein
MSIIVISYKTPGECIQLFKAEHNTENPTYNLLRKKLSDLSIISIGPEKDGWFHWLFTNQMDEESFMESFKWFVIYE